MSEIVSKELLREVLDDDVLRIGSFNYPRLEIEVQRYSYKDWLAINIHELAHKCKEWAWKKFQIDILIIKDGVKLDANHWRRNVYLQKNGKTIHFFGSHSNDIPFHNDNIAMVKACQWILDEEIKILIKSLYY